MVLFVKDINWEKLKRKILRQESSFDKDGNEYKEIVKVFLYVILIFLREHAYFRIIDSSANFCACSVVKPHTSMILPHIFSESVFVVNGFILCAPEVFSRKPTRSIFLNGVF